MRNKALLFNKRQKGESQNGGNKKKKQAKFSEKTFFKLGTVNHDYSNV